MILYADAGQGQGILASQGSSGRRDSREKQPSNIDVKLAVFRCQRVAWQFKASTRFLAVKQGFIQE